MEVYNMEFLAILIPLFIYGCLIVGGGDENDKN